VSLGDFIQPVLKDYTIFKEQKCRLGSKEKFKYSREIHIQKQKHCQRAMMTLRMGEGAQAKEYQ